jgi:hypothetical protein
MVPRGTPHTYWNPGPGRLRLPVMTSNTFRMIQEIHKMVDRNPEALQAVFRKYDSNCCDSSNSLCDETFYLAFHT